jgi:hypothetical protein
MVQYDSQTPDPHGTRLRRLTMAFSGPGGQFQYTQPHVTPDGRFAIIRAGCPNGVACDPLLVKIPALPTDPPVDRSVYQRVPVAVEAGAAYARVKFGYAEFGDPRERLYCETRGEECVTDAARKPFAYVQTDVLTPARCASGCTIEIPAISGRVVYYRVERSSDRSRWELSGGLRAAAVR